MLCTRCRHAEALPDGVLCPGCAAPAGFQAPPTGVAPNAWLRSPVGLGRAAAALLGLAAAVDVFALGADYFMYDVTGDPADYASDRGDLAHTLLSVAGGAQGFALIVCGVVYLVWFWRVRVNSEVFNPVGHRMRRGWTLGGWVVPIVNLWYPRRIMVDIWDASSAGNRPEGRALLNAWWALWLVSTAAGQVLYNAYDDADTSAEIHDAMSQVMIADTLDLLAALVAAALVLRVTRMQDRKAHAGPGVAVAV
ncbi:DUF4328 domain-containing protein [Streptomyces sp. SID13726]|uniref:DUF4328 domain-containing protein n=1 Tax=Streptomyces sp. SID13726 TaxID=2706058 RepID=UPI0013BDE949|nr:DUF4328 domain-containing protein [Streptomyces sp. SID13726]NEA99792.1 DUF4328 domain-containing protein [Streptomyces sp. SID13726]